MVEFNLNGVLNLIISVWNRIWSILFSINLTFLDYSVSLGNFFIGLVVINVVIRLLFVLPSKNSAGDSTSERLPEEN
ncbi:MAG: hypothetical protein IJO29_00265 [Oscillospiraceae bacterium]|nr:hypothetical protein [Oscillospiraceae bacterium]